jgi:ParB family transcriptional regulator, chromosome partitioning protein
MVSVNEIKTTKRSDLMLVDPRNLVIVEGFNVRHDMGDIESLSASILEIGLQVPLKAKKVRKSDKFELVDGHRRFKAIQHLLSSGHDIPFIEVQLFTGNEEDRVFSMVATGVGQKSLTELEQAEAIKRLISFHYKPEDIAPRIGKSVPHIYNMILLANASKKIKDKVVSGEISGTTIVHIIRQSDDEREQYKMVEDAIADAKSSGKKTATARNVSTLKTKKPEQKLKELISYLDASGIKNEKVELLVELVSNLKDGSIEELAKLF